MRAIGHRVCHAESAEPGQQTVFHDASFMYVSCTRVEGLWVSAFAAILLVLGSITQVGIRYTTPC